jgi:TonB family protein
MMTTMLVATAKAAVILGLALAVLPLLRRRSAALRHLVLAAAFAAAIVSPLAGLMAPSWSLPAALPAALPRRPPARATAADRPASPDTRPSLRPGSNGTDEAGSPSVAQYAAVVWLTGSGIGLLGLAFGLVRIASLQRGAGAMADARWSVRAAEIARQLGVSRRVRVRTTRHPSLLATIGVRQPTLLLPAAAAQWSDARVAVVLGHELAHVQRSDWIVQLAAELVRAWQWFNPLVWIACARLRQESEQACDDAVLQTGVAGPAYAEELVAVARELGGRREWLPVLAMAQPSGFERRIIRMLTPELDRRPVGRRAVAATAAAALAILLPIAGLAAQAAIARVAGQVADPQNGRLPDVTLVLTHTATGQRRELRSDRSGRFEFAGLEPGEYLLEAQLPGFQRFQSTLLVDSRSVERDLRLDVGTLQESITIRASRSGAPAPPVQGLTAEQLQRLEEFRRKRAAQTCTAPPREAPFIGGNLRVPIKLKDVRPVYPDQLRAAGVGGTVLMAARIGKDGLVDDIAITSSPHPALSEAAIEAVSRWEFDATLLNCLPTEVQMTVSVSFELTP